MNLRRRPKSAISAGWRNEIDPDAIFIDSKNLPDFDVHQFEGRIEKPIGLGAIIGLSVSFGIIFLVLLGKAWTLQAKDGATYAAMSQSNALDETTVFSQRGAIFDRNGEKLAWNRPMSDDTDFLARAYTETPGFSHILGYLKYPAKDKQGTYYRTDFEGVSGVEKFWNKELQGTYGTRVVEEDALGKVTSESVVKPPKDGENLVLSVDSVLQAEMYKAISNLAQRVGFSGGAGVVMDIHTGEILALTSYPEFSSAVMTNGTDSKAVAGYLSDTAGKPFLNRITGGLYTPGSIVKPYVATAALEEGTIDPNKQILSTGSISVPNPYDPTKKTTFMDWRPQGLVDMRKAIAVSSNVYFYEVGGGFEGQKGLGIERLNKYFGLFGFGKKPPEGFFDGPAGTVPSVAWKAKVFPGDPWRIGDTYFTSIGQYGWQVTPFQMIRALSSIANGGTLLTPTILKAGTSTEPVGEQVPVDPAHLQIIREGMREGAMIGTAAGLNVPYVKIAAKTGTAELGVSKAFVNSWVTGFFPYENPKYAFVVMMEHGPRANVYGATAAMREVFDWLHSTDSGYLK